tara:strand:- start:680 stop:1066 length:387 start_codon:yes stop_codon:yes gene_type:complete
MDSRYYRVRLSVTNTGTSDNQTVQLPTTAESANKVWLLSSFTFVRSGGSGSTWAPRLMQTSSAANDSIDQRMVYSAGSAVINDVFAQPMPCLADADGRLYFKAGFNSGSDNDYDAELWFIRAKGGAKS